MDIRDRRGLKLEAKLALEAAQCDPKKLILIHTGISATLSLVLALVSHLLQLQIDDTGGLSGVGMRTVLETAQMALMYGELAALIFWQIGYTFIALRISRRQSVEMSDLLEGFRRFGPVLRLRLLVVLLCAGVVFIGAYAGSMVFSLTPWAAPIAQAYESGNEEAVLAAMDAALLPMMGVVMTVIMILLAPYYYRLRMADYFLLDDPRAGAMMAIRRSRLVMRGNRIRLFQLDVSFWWFYGLELLTTLVGYGDLILPLFGVTLPWSGTVSYYVFLVLFYVCQLVLYWWKGNEIQVTYAGAYEALLPKDEEKDCA